MENKIIYLVNVLDCYAEHIDDTCLKFPDEMPRYKAIAVIILNSPDMQDSELMEVLSQMGRGGVRG